MVPITSGSDYFRLRSFPVTVISGSDQFRFRSVPVPIISLVTVISDSDHFRLRSVPVPIISGYVHFAPLDYGDCDLSIHLSVNLEFSNTADKSSLNISKLHKKMLLLHYALLHYAK